MNGEHLEATRRSVAQALEALRAKSNVEISKQGGWTTISEPATDTVWLFAPRGDAAYPAVVKRKVVPGDVKPSIKTDILCEARKTACDALARELVRVNKKVMREAARFMGE